jgi:hypothetical protein
MMTITTATGTPNDPSTIDWVWTIGAIRDLGATTDVETAGAILGIGRTKAYELAKTDNFPVRLIRIGRRYLVPVPAILHLLDIEQ